MLHKYSLSKAEAIVAAAGPIMNFIISFVFLIIYEIFARVVINGTINTAVLITQQILLSIIMVNLGLGVFNLIPIYPLDGSKVLNHFLPYKAKEWMANNQTILTIIVFIIVFCTDIISWISSYVLFGMEWLVTLILGIFI